MYTLMLKAAVRSNKSVETFVMGTLLDRLVASKACLQALPPSSFPDYHSDLLFNLFPHCGAWPQANIIL